MAKMSVTAREHRVQPPRWVRNLFTVGACYDLWIVGLVINTLGPLIPFFVRDFSLTPSAVAVIFTARGLGYLVSVIAGGLITDLYGRKVVVVSGGFFIAATLFLSIWVPSWNWILVLATITGVGQGLIDGVANVIMTDMHRKNPGRALNFLHVWYGVGAFVGPLMAGWVLNSGGSWSQVFGIVGVAALGLVAIFLPFPYPREYYLGAEPDPSEESGQGQSQASLQQALLQFINHPTFLLVASIMFLHNGISGTVSGWANSYLGEIFAFSTMEASLTVSMFSAGILVGRLLMGVMVEQLGYGRTLLFGSLGSFVSILVAVLAPTGWLSAVGFTSTGFFLASIFPTGLAVAGTLFPGNMGAVSGLLVGAGALGSMLVPGLIGVLVDLIGMRPAMASSGLLLAGMAAAGIAVYKTLKR
ncbi:MAG: MFS transporter [Firmicutes bacterium]|nr:MFS transporter [Bacillota bacterium]